MGQTSKKIVSLQDLALVKEPNIARFTARLDPEPTPHKCAKVVLGEGWSEAETRIEADAVIEYQNGQTPHLDFANLEPSKRALSDGAMCEGEKEALGFLSGWGPLKRKHYLPAKNVAGAPGHLDEPLQFRTPLLEFWHEQQKFRDLVAIWSDAGAGIRNAQWDKLASELNPSLRQMYPVLDSNAEGAPIARLGGQNDLLTSLFYCLWSDIAQQRQVRRCKNEFCGKFFRPSREAQLYDSEACKRRQLQREYARGKREASKSSRSARHKADK